MLGFIAVAKRVSENRMNLLGHNSEEMHWMREVVFFRDWLLNPGNRKAIVGHVIYVLKSWGVYSAHHWPQESSCLNKLEYLESRSLNPGQRQDCLAICMQRNKAQAAFVNASQIDVQLLWLIILDCSWIVTFAKPRGNLTASCWSSPATVSHRSKQKVPERPQRLPTRARGYQNSQCIRARWAIAEPGHGQ